MMATMATFLNLLDDYTGVIVQAFLFPFREPLDCALFTDCTLLDSYCPLLDWRQGCYGFLDLVERGTVFGHQRLAREFNRNGRCVTRNMGEKPSLYAAKIFRIGIQGRTHG